MPIFTYFAVVGSVMIALLFVAGATLDKGSPAVVTSQYGLPKPWRPVVTSDQDGLPKPWRPDPIHLAAAPAPAPDMTSPLVLAAAPKAQSGLKFWRRSSLRRVRRGLRRHPRSRTQQLPVDYRQNHAWSRDRDHAPFGGDRFFFGRF
jgi:hypothetical protein